VKYTLALLALYYNPLIAGTTRQKTALTAQYTITYDGSHGTSIKRWTVESEQSMATQHKT